jgi:GntR family transcriptional regulator
MGVANDDDGSERGSSRSAGDRHRPATDGDVGPGEHDAGAAGDEGSRMRRIRYQEIAEGLRERVRRASAGSVLPSEAEMSHEFGASRVTVRRALELLRDEGLIAARQGFGWFVATEPLQQSLRSLGTIEDQVEGVGKLSERKVEEFAFEPAPALVARILGVDQVLRVKRVNLADGEPFAVVTVWCPAELGAGLSRREVERRPFYELLDVDLHGASQTIGADAATSPDAALLGVPVGAPLLRCRRVTTDRDGEAVLVSEHLFPAHRTEFVVDLPQAEPSMTPSGLRLVT